MTETIHRTPSFTARWLMPVVIAVLTLGLYLDTLSNVHTFDALSYIRDVEQRTGLFFHPHHLLYSPTGWLFWQFWQIFGYQGTPELPLKVLNSLAGMVVGVGVYSFMLRLTGRWWAAVLSTGLLVFNYGVWFFSVEVEVYLLALVWLLLVLVFLIDLVRQPQIRTAALLAVSVGLAALYHQTNVLLVPLVVLAVTMSPLRFIDRVHYLLYVGCISGAIVGFAYALIGLGVNGYRSWDEIRHWLFFFVETGWWGQPTRDRLTDLGAGLGNSISPEGAWGFWVCIVVILIIGIPRLIRHRPREVVLCSAWLIIYGAFFSWWEGDNIEFWIGTLLPLWVLVGMSAAQLANVWASVVPIRRLPISFVVCILPLFLAWHNYFIVRQRGDARQDLQRQLAVGVHQASAPNDLIVSSGGVMELYLPYYEERHNVHTVNGTVFETNGNVSEALDRLRSIIDTNIQAGQAIIVDRDALKPTPDKNGVQRYPITQAQLDALWQPYRAAFEPAVVRDGVTYFWRIPSATMVAQQAGWRWRTFDWGWQAENIAESRFTGSWCFNSERDPILISPLMNIEARSYRTLEITLQTSVTHQQAQLFYAGPSGVMSDEHSVRWPLEEDGGRHTYSISLADAAGWQDMIVRLRLDPIEEGDGTSNAQTCIESLRFLP